MNQKVRWHRNDPERFCTTFAEAFNSGQVEALLGSVGNFVFLTDACGNKQEFDHSMSPRMPRILPTERSAAVRVAPAPVRNPGVPVPEVRSPGPSAQQRTRALPGKLLVLTTVWRWTTTNDACNTHDKTHARLISAVARLIDALFRGERRAARSSVGILRFNSPFRTSVTDPGP